VLEDRLDARSDPVRERFESGYDVLADFSQGVHLCALGYQFARFAWIGEERHGWLGPGDDEVLDPVELAFGLFGEVGEPLDGGQVRPALKSCGEGFQERTGPCAGGDAADRPQSALAAGRAARQQRGRFTGAQDFGNCLHSGFGDRLWSGGEDRFCSLAAAVPGHVRGEDQRGHLPGRDLRCGDGGRRVCGDVGCVGRLADPAL